MNGPGTRSPAASFLRERPARRRLASAPLHTAAIAVAGAGVLMLAGAAAGAAGDGREVAALAVPGTACLALGLAVRWATAVPRRLPARSAFSAVAAGWTMFCLAAAVPYVTTDALGAFDALFESVAGATTTAATTLAEVETLPDGLLVFRALTQWAGGLAVIVLAVAVLPYLGAGGMSLLQSELPAASEVLAVRVAQTARRLWPFYAGFTVAMAGVYLAAGMGLFDAVGHGLTTVSTGGFSTRDGGFAAFDSAGLEWAATAGMFVAGMNVVLVWSAVRGRAGPLLRSAEARAYAALVATAAAAVVAWNAADTTFGAETIRHSVFTVVSIVSTTGYAVADFGRWVQPVQTVLLLLMFVGAMTASPGGGAKVLRFLALGSHARRETARHLHRRLVGVVRVGHEVVPEDVVSRILGYFSIFVMAIGMGTLAVASSDVDLVTAFSSVTSSLANVGPALGELSPAGTAMAVSAGARGVHMILMLLGRLEIYPVLLGLTALAEGVRSFRPRRVSRLLTTRA